jgi:hypothetical protein
MQMNTDSKIQKSSGESGLLGNGLLARSVRVTFDTKAGRRVWKDMAPGSRRTPGQLHFSFLRHPTSKPSPMRNILRGIPIALA